MGINERKQREKQEMRTHILETAMKLFLEEGFQNVSLRRIADKIEYSPATIYLYFKNKDEILYALHNAGFEELYKRQQTVLSIKDPKKRLLKHGEVYIGFALENPEYYNLMFIMRSPIRKIAKGEEWNSGIRSYEFFKADVRRAINAKIIKKADIDVATFAMWSLAHGIVALILRNRCPMMDQQHLPAVAHDTFAYIMKNFGLHS
jgi:AcrR family transcriptional regulator